GLVRRLPECERFGLISQIQRAAASIPANIAEGKGRGQSRVFLNFLAIASGSLSELDTHFELACQLGYFGDDDLRDVRKLMNDVGRLLTAFRQSIQRRLKPSSGDKR
ncbi:MAG TPA: four helix bundle protein, partial [Planctomycetaceae bacterium]|nr:four helix bundle protein [Planctomycetaceae bacterium]